MNRKLSLFAFLCLALPLTGCASEKDSETKSNEQTPVASVNASALYKEYDANQVSADEKYKGKTLLVVGTVDSIGKDIMDTPYIALKTGGDLSEVQCMFADDHKSELAKVHKGQIVTVRGVCDGKLVSVILRGCSISK